MSTRAKTIVAIGGGRMSLLETLGIDRAVVSLAGKATPRALFIPTASYDDATHYEVFRAVYGKKLGCATDVLYLLKDAPSLAVLRRKILSADLIYVGGGNTLMMMKLWRRLGVDKLLRAAYEGGVVCAGLSAGAICWFANGHSDSMAFQTPDKWKYIRVKGLGFFPFTICPHFRGEHRVKNFREMIGRMGGSGLALDNNCAVAIVNGNYRVLSTRKDAHAFTVKRLQGRVVQQAIAHGSQLRPLSELA